MNRDEILAHYHERPFRPFIVHVADGRKLRVDHPEFFAITGQRSIVVAKPAGGIDILDAMLITGIEVPESKSRRGRNGRGRGKAA